jgi:uncharacterized protein with HEPN domain
MHPDLKIWLKDIKHGYDSVSDDVIWLIATRHLPILEREVKELLK